MRISSGTPPVHCQSSAFQAIVRSQGAESGRPKPKSDMEEKRITMRNLRTLALVTLMLGPVAASVFGQSGTPTMKVTVPFQFSIDRTTLSAGQYLITSTDDTLLVQEATGRNVALLVTRRYTDKLSEQKSRAIFDCYFGECFLSQVWFGRQGAGRILPSSKHQVELASKGGGQQFALLGAKPQR